MAASCSRVVVLEITRRGGSGKFRRQVRGLYQCRLGSSKRRVMLDDEAVFVCVLCFAITIRHIVPSLYNYHFLILVYAVDLSSKSRFLLYYDT